MTVYPTRRAAREAWSTSASRHAQKGRRSARARVAQDAPSSSELTRAKQWRSGGRVTAAAAAAVFLAGSAIVAIPANATTSPTGTVYADQLIAHTQSLHVPGGIAQPSVDQPKYASAGFTRPDGTPAITVGGLTNVDWAALVLQDGKFPVTPNNLTVMLQWMDSENDPHSWWLRNNPLNNGLGSGGGSGFGSYANLTIAASYVAQQLRRNLFSGIASSFESNAPVSASAQAIIASPWAGGHYNYGAIWHAVNVPIVAAPASDW